MPLLGSTFLSHGEKVSPCGCVLATFRTTKVIIKVLCMNSEDTFVGRKQGGKKRGEGEEDIIYKIF